MENIAKEFLIYYILNFLITLGIGLIILFLLINPYLSKGKNLGNYTNNYCSNENNVHYDLLCTNKYFKNRNYKKSKFIWITLDGTATSQLVELHNLEKYKITTSFLNIGNYNKYTNSLYESMMTGKYNKNIFGAEIKYDNFMKQVIEANYSISFKGWTYPIPGLIGDNLTNQFYKKNIDDDHEISVFNSFCNMTYLYPFLYIDFLNYQKTSPINKKINSELEKKIIDLINKVRDDDYYLLKNISQNIFFKELDDIFIKEPNILLELNISNCLINNFNWKENSNISMIYYSTEIDEYNHFYGKNHIYSLLQSYIAEKMIINLMKWIDEHPDYALIVNSDHGGQHFYGEDIIRNHGEDFPGNEGIFFIYTKEFKDNYDELKMKERYINILDESTLMSEILLNVNIPLESRGIPYPLINDENFIYSSLKRKEAQLIQLIQYFDKDNKNKKLEKILKELNQSFNGIDNIKDKYLNKNENEQINLIEELRQKNKDNLDKIINQQNEINEIIRNNNHTNNNIMILVLVIALLSIKYYFEIYDVFLLLNKFYFYIIGYSKFEKLMLAIFFIFYLSLIEFIFLFFSDTSNNAEFFVELFIFITCIILLIMKIIITSCKIKRTKFNDKIIYYLIMLFGYLSFHIFSEYSYTFNKVKSFFSRRKPQLVLNLCILYPILIIYSIYEIKKFDFKYKNRKGRNAFLFIIIINIIFIISILLEDISYKNYYSQNKLNAISMFISFIVYIIYFFSCFIINSLDLQMSHDSFSVSQRIELNYINKSNIVPIKSREIMIKEKPTDKNELFFNIINNKKENGKKDEHLLMHYYYNNILFLKLCIIQGSFWLSDESEKIFIFLSLIFFEFSEYFNNIFYHNIVITRRGAPDNFIKILKEIKEGKEKIEQNEIKDESIFSNVFYIIIQKMIINMNHIFCLLIIHCYDMNSSKSQEQKFIKVFPSLGEIISYISNFKFSFIAISYLLEINIKNVYQIKKHEEGIEFLLFFIIKRIIINLKLNNTGIMLVYHSLFKVKEEELLSLYNYYLADLIIFLFDFIYIIFSFAFYKIVNW